jgi:HEAT repeat protein
MPITKRNQPASAPSGSNDISGQALRRAQLSSANPETRWTAARALGTEPEAVEALAIAMKDEKVVRVRQAIVTALIRIGNKASVAALLPYLRSQDAAARTVTIDALQAIPQAVSPFMATLLSDDDSDVRLLACELVRNMPAQEATALLAGVLQTDPHPNVCGAAVEVLAEVGTAQALPALNACAERFATAPFLPFAISVAISRISGAGA